MRRKTNVRTNLSLDQAQQASQTFVANETRKTEIEVEMNRRIDDIKSEYQPELTELEEAQREPAEILAAYAGEQKHTWGKKKSFELLHLVIGYRTGNLKATKPKTQSWEATIKLIRKAFPKLIRTTEEINKEAIIALSKTDEKAFEKLKKVGNIDVTRDETFYIEVKKEKLAESLCPVFPDCLD